MEGERAGDHGALMDGIYRYERHLYDPLRKLFLHGRDRLLDRLAVAAPGRVLELGCGTARNLIRLHRRLPEARLYGLDASAKMLATAGSKLRRRGMTERVELRRGLTENFDRRVVFALEEPFDAVFFSYSLTMMADPRRAIDSALASLAPGGRLYAVDFWDQAGWPSAGRRLFTAILARYRVRYRPEMLDYLRQLDDEGRSRLEIEPILSRYAFFATLDT